MILKIFESNKFYNATSKKQENKGKKEENERKTGTYFKQLLPENFKTIDFITAVITTLYNNNKKKNKKIKLQSSFNNPIMTTEKSITYHAIEVAKNKRNLRRCFNIHVKCISWRYSVVCFAVSNNFLRKLFKELF